MAAKVSEATPRKRTARATVKTLPSRSRCIHDVEGGCEACGQVLNSVRDQVALARDPRPNVAPQQAEGAKVQGLVGDWLVTITPCNTGSKPGVGQALFQHPTGRYQAVGLLGSDVCATLVDESCVEVDLPGGGTKLFYADGEQPQNPATPHLAICNIVRATVKTWLGIDVTDGRSIVDKTTKLSEAKLAADIAANPGDCHSCLNVYVRLKDKREDFLFWFGDVPFDGDVFIEASAAEIVNSPFACVQRTSEHKDELCTVIVQSDGRATLEFHAGAS